ncbi:Dynactin subunit 6 [Balamuthia mandrillaris]
MEYGVGDVSIAATAVVCKTAVLEGNIRIGKGTVLHPKCRVIAEGGPIHIGSNNIVEELACIHNRSTTGETLEIGDNNAIEIGAVVHAKRIGNNNVIEAKAKLGEGCVIGNGCTIGMAVVVGSNDSVSDGTVVFGERNAQRKAEDAKEAHLAIHIRHLRILHQTLPKYNQVLKPSST